MSKTERAELRLPTDLLEEIDVWRSNQSDIPNKSEAIRRLVVAGLSNDQSKQLFEVARLQIKLAAANPQTARRLPLSYVYAWDWRIYPMQDDGDGIAKSFETCFDVREDQVYELARFLDDRWLEKNPITFYQLEDQFDVRSRNDRWDRSKLIGVCRYFFLKGHFDSDFWMNLLAPMQYPSEATGITWDPEEDRAIYFA